MQDSAGWWYLKEHNNLIDLIKYNARKTYQYAKAFH